MSLEDVIARQLEFQELCDVNINTIVASEINALSEMFLFKTIEEIVELRKEFPSELNKWSKSQGGENRDRILDELGDVALFLLNFTLTRKIPLTELLSHLGQVQDRNFTKLKEKQLKILFDEISRIDTPENLSIPINYGVMPKLVVVTYDLPIKSREFLDRVLINKKTRLKKQDVYYAPLVKSNLTGITIPVLLKYWLPLLYRELKIIKAGTSPLFIMENSRDLDEALREMPAEFKMPVLYSVQSPSYYLTNGFSENDYFEQHIKPLVEKL